MSTTYKIIAGDTFSIIASRIYGDDKESGNIARANPGVSEPLTPGTSIVVPDLPAAPKNISQKTDSDNIDEVAILIDGQRFRFWTNVRISRAIDTIDSIIFSAPFNHTDIKFREAFRPFSYREVQITVGDLPIFTGTMVLPDPKLAIRKITVDVSCYSLPGVLGDCTPPASSFPLEFDGQGLIQIAETLAKPFGIKVEFEAEQGAIFEEVACDPGKKIISFLTVLAKQRKLVISSTAKGALLFRQSASTGNPVANLSQGDSPVSLVTPRFKPQSYFSDITGLEDTFVNSIFSSIFGVGSSGSQFTVKNPHLEKTRPFTFKPHDSTEGALKAAVEMKAGLMIADMVSYDVELSTWRDPQGELWTANTTLKLIAPGAMIYSSYEFIIRSVDFMKDSKSQTAVLNLILPGSFQGTFPEVLPWDE